MHFILSNKFNFFFPFHQKFILTKIILVPIILSLLVISSAKSQEIFSQKIIQNKKTNYLNLKTPSQSNQDYANNILPKITITANSDDQDARNYSEQKILSSNRMKTALIDTPQAISVINQAQIHEQNITNMEQAVRYIPSFNIQQGEGNRDQLTIRGNSSSADFYVDSTRDDLQYIRDFYNAKSIEFLRGPNAVSFGRGGAGGLVNRVSKTADGKTSKSINLTTGSFDNRRAEFDIGDKINQKFFLRLNTVYEKSNSYRDFVNFEKYGFNPTATIILGDNTDLKISYEHFFDQRVADRGIPSKNNGAFKTSSSTFFGNPQESYATTRINNFSTILSHDFSKNFNLRNLTKYSVNNKFYQNVYASSSVDSSNNFKISAYNNLTQRQNFTNQLDLTTNFDTYNLKHQALIGLEITRQDSLNLRKNGSFNNNSSLTLSSSNSVDYSPIIYSKSTSVNDLISEVRVYGLYLQDKIDLNKYFQLLAGIRQDRFEINLRNNHTMQKFSRIDSLTSPRLGLVFKPRKNLAIYTNYSVSYLPNVGDQFDTMSSQIKNLKPEKIQNYEIGSKIDLTKELSFATAIFELQRKNSKFADPNNPGFYFLSGETRTRGLELEGKGKITQRLNSTISYTLQDAMVVGQTTSAQKNNKIALAPRQKFSWLNKFDYNQNIGFSLALIRQSSQFAGSNNSIKIKGFKRFDFGLYYKFNKQYRAQLNVENIFNEKYILTAHNNYNIMPGSIRAFKLSFNGEF